MAQTDASVDSPVNDLSAAPDVRAQAFERHGVTAPEFDPACFDHWRAIGRFLFEQGRIDQAIGCFDRALALKPDAAATRFDRGRCYLLLGDFSRGFADYEARLLDHPERYESRLPRWHGEPTDRRVLLHCEQGNGDIIQSMRYFEAVRQRCPKLAIWNGNPGLQRLLARHFPAVMQGPMRLQDFDLYAPSMSLPLALGMPDPRGAPGAPYLIADGNRVTRWATRMATRAGLKVGLAWQGHANTPRGQFRSVPIELLARLGDVSSTAFYSLQYPSPDRRPDFAVDLAADIADFEDTAAILENLDLVITSDSAVAHLAGALGKPVWILLASVADWRWHLDRDDSPWYPTARLFRQPAAGDWTSVVDRVRARLSALAAGA
jgi:tetratricopeptide (TPR) repeat protein